jgi:hypothetical protein
MDMRSTLLVLAGAAAGGTLGYLGFFWIAQQGFYALVLPGGLLGLGASLAPNRWIGWAVICGAAALALGLYTEWQFAPFKADESMSYFMTHLHQLKPVTWLMILVGAAIGFWGPFSRLRQTQRVVSKPGAQ